MPESILYSDEVVSETLWEGFNRYLEGKDISSFNFTPSAVLIATISGSLSCVSSLVIISIIIRSKKSSPYHRIMLIYSFFDFVFSLAIALTTLPMPKTVANENILYAEFGGSSYGNESTCIIQGFTILFCVGGLMFSASLLYIYYYCSIVSKMPKETFVSKVERPFVLCSLIVMVAYSLVTLLLYRDMINPSPLAPWCSWDTYPHGCNDDSDNELICIRGNSEDQKVLLLMLIPVLFISF